MLHIVNAALAQKATDIHIVCKNNEEKIYFVIDGKLHEQQECSLSESLSQKCGCFFAESSTEKFDPEAMQSGTVYDAFESPLIIRFQTVPLYDPFEDNWHKKFEMLLKLLPQYKPGLNESKGCVPL